MAFKYEVLRMHGKLKVRAVHKVFILVVFAASISVACGKKGPLYLPKSTPQTLQKAEKEPVKAAAASAKPSVDEAK